MSFRNYKTTFIERVLNNEGHAIKVAGGAVRDFVLGMKPKDIDFATTARPKEMVEAFIDEGVYVVGVSDKKDGIYDLEKIPGYSHGTIRVIIDNETFEITTLRCDIETDGRHAKVQFVNDFRKDAERRDLTFNAMFSDLDGKIDDYFGGLSDLESKTVRFVGNADERIKEDALRALRYFRFSARFGNDTINRDAYTAITKNRDLINKLSGERIWQEMSKIITHENGLRELNTMLHMGVLEAIEMPLSEELLVRDNHVFTSSVEPSYALGYLLMNKDIKDIESLSKRWRLSSTELKNILFVVNNRDLLNDKPKKFAALKARGEDFERIKMLTTVFNRPDVYLEYIENIPPFPVTGEDLLKLGMKPGKEMGNLLKDLREKWIETDFSLSKDDLLSNVGNTLIK